MSLKLFFVTSLPSSRRLNNRSLVIKMDSAAQELLQQAVVRYHKEYLQDDRFMRENFSQLTNGGRRNHFKSFIELCEAKAPSSEIEDHLAKSSKLDLSMFRFVKNADYEGLIEAAKSVLAKIPEKETEAKRARRKFIRDLGYIFNSIRLGAFPVEAFTTSNRATFFRFVRAALKPFPGATQGCEADIKFVSAQMKGEQRALLETEHV